MIQRTRSTDNLESSRLYSKYNILATNEQYPNEFRSNSFQYWLFGVHFEDWLSIGYGIDSSAWNAISVSSDARSCIRGVARLSPGGTNQREKKIAAGLTWLACVRRLSDYLGANRQSGSKLAWMARSDCSSSSKVNETKEVLCLMRDIFVGESFTKFIQSLTICLRVGWNCPLNAGWPWHAVIISMPMKRLSFTVELCQGRSQMVWCICDKNGRKN